MNLLNIFPTYRNAIKENKQLKQDLDYLKSEIKYLKSRTKAHDLLLSSLDSKFYDLDNFIDEYILNIKG